jgi:hypothetical protein
MKTAMARRIEFITIGNEKSVLAAINKIGAVRPAARVAHISILSCLFARDVCTRSIAYLRFSILMSKMMDRSKRKVVYKIPGLSVFKRSGSPDTSSYIKGV